MADRHPMPSGNWVELRDWRELRRGDKKKAIAAVTDTGKAAAAGYEVADGLLTLLITNWSYQLPLPSQSPESLDLLPMEDDEPLMNMIMPVIRSLFPAKADGSDPAQVGDPASPTVPSVA